MSRLLILAIVFWSPLVLATSLAEPEVVVLSKSYLGGSTIALRCSETTCTVAIGIGTKRFHFSEAELGLPGPLVPDSIALMTGFGTGSVFLGFEVEYFCPDTSSEPVKFRCFGSVSMLNGRISRVDKYRRPWDDIGTPERD